MRISIGGSPKGQPQAPSASWRTILREGDQGFPRQGVQGSEKPPSVFEEESAGKGKGPSEQPEEAGGGKGPQPPTGSGGTRGGNGSLPPVPCVGIGGEPPTRDGIRHGVGRVPPVGQDTHSIRLGGAPHSGKGSGGGIGEVPPQVTQMASPPTAPGTGNGEVPPMEADARYEARIGAHRQPPMARMRQIISEFAYTVTLDLSSWDQVGLDHKLCTTKETATVPSGVRLLRCGQEGEMTKKDLQEVIRRTGEGKSPGKVTFGVFRSEAQFVKQALMTPHPFDACVSVPDALLEVMAAILREGPLKIMQMRLKTLSTWRRWAAQLTDEEASLKSTLAPEVRDVLMSKRLCLLEKIAHSLNWPDKEIHRDMREGFRLTGEPPPSGVFKQDQRRATISEEDLWAKAKHVKPALWAKIKAERGSERSLWDMTIGEVHERAWMSGPHSWQELEDRFDGAWIPTRRFGIEQRGKLRPIDDLSESFVNAAYGAAETVDLRALDEVVWSAAALMRMIYHQGYYEFALADGRVLKGPVHASLRQTETWKGLRLKTVDLRAAYKQLPINPDDAAKSVVSLKEPGADEPKGFILKVLPFGGAASVVAFNRVARLLQRIVQELCIMAFNYYDDYPVLEIKGLTHSTEKSIRVVMDLLGFACSVEKEKPFDTKADMLGVTVDVGDPWFEKVKVGNKKERAEELGSALQLVLDQGFLEPRSVASLFGRLQFAESQVLGRQGRLALAELRWIERQSHKHRLSQLDVAVLESLRDRMTHGRPRTIQVRPQAGVTYVFTDGACETYGEKYLGSVGAVMYHEVCGVWQCRSFGCILSDSLMEEWAKQGKKHYIGPVELYAVVLARARWASFLNNARVIFFVDHSGVLAACIKGNARDKLWRELLLRLEQVDAAGPMVPWFSRVPSPSNAGDGPSRGRWDFPLVGVHTRDYPFCVLGHGLLRSSELLVKRGEELQRAM